MAFQWVCLLSLGGTEFFFQIIIEIPEDAPGILLIEKCRDYLHLFVGEIIISADVAELVGYDVVPDLRHRLFFRRSSCARCLRSERSG